MAFLATLLAALLAYISSPWLSARSNQIEITKLKSNAELLACQADVEASEYSRGTLDKPNPDKSPTNL